MKLYFIFIRNSVSNIGVVDYSKDLFGSKEFIGILEDSIS
jgi:hypothetical protein